MASDICIICNTAAIIGSDGVVELRDKGCVGLNNASKKRHDVLVFVPGQGVHSLCRQQYCKPQTIAKLLAQTPVNDVTVRSRRSLETFAFKTNCLFCGSTIVTGKKRTTSLETSSASTIELKKVTGDNL